MTAQQGLTGHSRSSGQAAFVGKRRALCLSHSKVPIDELHLAKLHRLHGRTRAAFSWLSTVIRNERRWKAVIGRQRPAAQLSNPDTVARNGGRDPGPRWSSGKDANSSAQLI